MSEDTNPPAPAPAKNRPRPYPIAATLNYPSAKKPVEVVFLSLTGFIAKLSAHIVQVGEHCEIEMMLVGHGVLTKCRALKTYDKSLDPKEHKVERLAEFHFEKLTSDHKTVIQEFIRQAGQK